MTDPFIQNIAYQSNPWPWCCWHQKI